MGFFSFALEAVIPTAAPQPTAVIPTGARSAEWRDLQFVLQARPCFSLHVNPALKFAPTEIEPNSSDLVAAIFGQMSALSRIVYIIVGLCGLYCATLLFQPTTAHTRSEIRRAA